MGDHTRRSALAAVGAVVGTAGCSGLDESRHWSDAPVGTSAVPWPTAAGGFARRSHVERSVPSPAFDVRPLVADLPTRGVQPAIADGVAYVPLERTADGGLAAVEVETGSRRWIADVDSIRTTPTVVGDTVVAVGEYVWALSRSDGSRYWRNRREAIHDDQTPVVADESVVTPEGDALDAATGATLDDRSFRASALPENRRAAEIAAGDGSVVVTYRGVGAGVVAFDAGSGRPRWTVEVVSGLGTPVVTDDRVFVTVEGRTAALTSDTGRVEWETEANGTFGHRPAYAEGRLLVPERPGRVRAIDPATGDRLWTAAGGWRDRTWLVATDDGVLVVTRGGTVALVADGRVQWERDLETVEFVADQPVVTDERVLFTGRVSTADGSRSGLFALRSDR